MSKTKSRPVEKWMVEEWIALYKKGESTLKIGKKYNRNPSVINKYLKLNGVELRSNSINSKVYKIENETFFENIDCEEKAYYLGFIYADGYITTKTKGNGAQSFGISINPQDVKLLKDLKELLGASHEIRRYKISSGFGKDGEYVRLLIKSQKIVDDLKDKGVVERKTNVCKFPKDKIPYELIRHFIRGYMDGDGSVGKTRRECNGYEFNVSFTGTDDMLNSILDYLIENNLINNRIKLQKRHKWQSVSYIKIGGNYQVHRILSHIYNDSTYYLERKFNRFIELENQNNSLA